MGDLELVASPRAPAKPMPADSMTWGELAAALAAIPGHLRDRPAVLQAIGVAKPLQVCGAVELRAADPDPVLFVRGR